MKTGIATWLLVSVVCATVPSADALHVYMYHNGSGQSILEVRSPCPKGYDVGFLQQLDADENVPGWKKSKDGLSRGVFEPLDPPTKHDEFGRLIHWYDVGEAISLDWKYCVVDRSVCDRLHLGWNPPEEGIIPGLPTDPVVICSMVLG